VKLGSEEQLVLPGYGVEAVLKNMEYSAVDEKARAAAAAAAKKAMHDSDMEAGKDEELGEVKGFKFDVLVARKPELRQELLTFRDTISSADDDKALKVSLK
jgi:UDP-glucose:glycoprotein glucosyltransferase